MKAPCKIIKYKKKRDPSQPIVPKKPEPVPVDSTPSKTSNEEEEEYDLTGEYNLGEQELAFLYDLKTSAEPQKNPVEAFKGCLQNKRFIPQDLSSDFINLFLSAAEFDPCEAEARLEAYFRSRQEPSPLFRDRDLFSPENAKIFKKLYVLPMPGTTKDGMKIILTGLTSPTVHYCQMEHAKALAFVFDLLIWEKDFGHGDFVVVLDGRNFQCPQLLQNNIRNHRAITKLLLDTIPGNLRSFYFLCPPPYVANIADNRNRIWFTVIKNKEEMITHLPANMLPLEYGGTFGRLQEHLDRWNEHMTQNRDFFVHFERKMIQYHGIRVCREREKAEGGKNWVSKIKLAADEWEYKIKYYEKMKNFQPLTHPAYGPERRHNMPKSNSTIHHPLEAIRGRIQHEIEEEEILNSEIRELAKEQPKESNEPEPRQYCYVFKL